MPDDTKTLRIAEISPYLTRPLRSLEQVAEGRIKLAEQKRYQDAMTVLENLYWAVENSISGEQLWKLRNELRAAEDLMRKGKS